MESSGHTTKRLTLKQFRAAWDKDPSLSLSAYLEDVEKKLRAIFISNGVKVPKSGRPFPGRRLLDLTKDKCTKDLHPDVQMAVDVLDDLLFLQSCWRQGIMAKLKKDLPADDLSLLSHLHDGIIRAAIKVGVFAHLHHVTPMLTKTEKFEHKDKPHKPRNEERDILIRTLHADGRTCGEIGQNVEVVKLNHGKRMSYGAVKKVCQRAK
jgi:hypothetical protein